MNNTTQIPVWDPLVRIFHWTLVVAFSVSYLTGEEDTVWHIYSGYTVIGLLLIRLVWGFIGTRHARFTDFLYRPGDILAYVKAFIARKPKHYDGHNPLGGIMVIAILLTLLATTLSGLMLYAVEEHAGPFAAFTASAGSVTRDGLAAGNEIQTSGGGEEFWEELHEFFSTLALTLVVFHILGVIVASAVHGENLVKAMIVGTKPGGPEAGADTSASDENRN